MKILVMPLSEFCKRANDKRFKSIKDIMEDYEEVVEEQYLNHNLIYSTTE